MAKAAETTSSDDRKKKTKLVANDHFLLVPLFWNFKRIERWESYVSRYEKQLKDKLDDEIKLTGFEALVPDELE